MPRRLSTTSGVRQRLIDTMQASWDRWRIEGRMCELERALKAGESVVLSGSELARAGLPYGGGGACAGAAVPVGRVRPDPRVLRRCVSVPAQVRPGIDHLSPIGEKLLPDFFTEDRSELWDALRERGPVVFIEDSVFMNGYCLTRADDVLAALRNPEVFSLNPVLDRPDHARWRAILQPLLSSRAVKQMQPALQDQAAAVVEAVAAQGSCEVIADVAEPFAAQVLLTVLGLPPQDGDRLLGWEKALWAIQRAPLAAVKGVRFEDLVQKVEMLAYLAEAFAQRRAGPDIAGVVSRLVAGDDRFDEADACAVVEMLIAAGITPFRSAVGFVFLELARDPRLCASLRENPAGIGGFVEDVLRREPPAPVIIRRAAQNVTVAGVEIPAGARVVLCVGAAIQEDMADGHGSRADYWAFGGGPHRCVAVSLAKTALTVLVSEWLRTIPAFGLDAESVPPVILEEAVRLSSLPLRWH